MDVEAHIENHKRNVSLEKRQEFLKLIRKSDFKIVDQLGQTSSKISILSLLLSSEARITTLMKVLNTAHKMQDITVDQFDDVVANITANRYLGFNDIELPVRGASHNRALHISATCIYTILSIILVDIYSSLNVKDNHNRLYLTRLITWILLVLNVWPTQNNPFLKK